MNIHIINYNPQNLSYIRLQCFCSSEVCLFLAYISILFLVQLPVDNLKSLKTQLYLQCTSLSLVASIQISMFDVEIKNFLAIVPIVLSLNSTCFCCHDVSSYLFCHGVHSQFLGEILQF